MRFAAYTCLLLALAAGLALAGPTVDMVPTTTPPQLDGRLTDAAWQGKPRLTGFVLNRDSQPASAQTEVILTYDDANLYLGARALEPDLTKLVTQASAAEASRVWSDDALELFVDALHNGYSFFHLGVTAAGITAAQQATVRGGTDIEPGPTVATGREAGAWTVELALPWRALGVHPVAGEIWGLNVCRSRPHAREYGSWSGVQGGYGQPQYFGEARFNAANGLVVTTRGLAAPEGNANQRNVLAGTLQATGAGRLTASVNSTARAAGATQTVPVTTGATVAFEVPYQVAGAEGEQLQFAVALDGRKLYAQTVPVRRVTQARVWQTERPVYQELWGKTGPGLGSRGVIMWAHAIVDYEMGVYCLKYAEPWVLEDQYATAARHNLRFIMNADLLPRNTFRARDYADKYGLKFVLMGNTRAHGEGVPLDGDHGWLIDPANQAVFIQQITDYLQGPYGKYVWAVMTADELQEWQLTLGLQMRAKGPYPYLDQVDCEVREQYGAGKYGLPASPQDKDPFRWIAYRRWYNAQMREFQKRVYQAVKRVAPQVLVIGPDPVASVMPLDYSGYGRYTDLMTNQLYPRHSRWEQDFAWITKTVADLSGKPTLPCAHVENYAGAFTPDEAREMMSQVYRGGGEGFHLYLPDTAGAQRKDHNLKLDRNGSPARWATVMGIVDRAAHDPRPVLPPTRAAILYSNDGHMGEYLGEMKGKEQYRWLFNLLGPIAGGWFKVIDDEQIARGEVKLADYQVIYVPNAEYQRRAVVAALEAYVRGGGKLVVMQPKAFTWDVDGTKLDDVRGALLPATGDNPLHQSVKPTGVGPVRATTQPLALVYGRGMSPSLAGGAQAFLTYEDGQPAAVARPVGRGMVYAFGFEPLWQSTLNNAGWRAYFKAFHSGLGQAVDLPIWRYTFPPVAGADPKPPSGRCLTNNFVMWITNEMVPVRNVATSGTYTYSLPPDLRPDVGGSSNVPFAQGALTNRRHCLDVKDAPYWETFAQFAAGWKTTAPFTITFDLGAPYPLDRVWLMVNGQLPSVTVEGLVQGQWRTLGQCAGLTPENRGDYPAVTIPLDGRAAAVQQMRLSFAEREAGSQLIIPELEIWARE